MEELKLFITQELGRRGCLLDDDALTCFATVWQKQYGTADVKLLQGFLEILADYDCDTENGRLDYKTVELFLDDELGIDYKTVDRLLANVD